MASQLEPVTATPEDSILKGFLSLGSGILLARLVAFIGTAYLARTLGSYGFGIVGFAVAITTFVKVGLRSGFEPVGSREVARDAASASSLAAGVALLRLGIAGLAVALLTSIALHLHKPREVQLVVVLWSLNLLPLALDQCWTYRGLGRNRRIGISMVLSQLVYVGCLLLSVKGVTDVYWVPLSMLAGESIAVAYLTLPLIHSWDWRPDIRRAMRVLRASGFLVASGMLSAVMQTADVVMVAFLLGESEVGFYSAAYRLSFLVMAIAVALQSAYLPRLARAARDSLQLTRNLTRRAFEFAAALAVPIGVGGWLLAEPLLTHLFGSEYGVADGALRYLLLAMGLFFFNGILLQLTVAFDRTRPELWIRTVAAVVNVGLNLLWIPRIGIEGAAAATLVAEGIIFILRFLVCRQVGVAATFSGLWRPLAAAAGMAVTIHWIDLRWGIWWISLVGGGLLYLGLLTALRGLPRDLRGS